MAEDQNNQLPPVVAANLGNLNPAHLTMYDYSKPTLTGAESSIARLAIVANNFKLKPNTIQMIQQFVHLNPSTRQLIDAAAGGTINNKTPKEAYDFIEKMSLNNYQWQVMRRKPMKVANVFNIDAVTMLSNQETPRKNVIEPRSNSCKKKTIYEERRLQIDELDEWWTNVKEKPRIHDEKHKEATNHFKVGDQIQDMGKLPSSFILRSVVNGGSHLSNFHSFSSSSNNIATHIKALSRIDFGFSVLGKILKLGVEPSAVTLSTLINGFCNQSKIFEAISIFDEMTERGYQPDLIVYSTILKGLCKSGNTDRAVGFLRLMEGRGRGIESNVVTYDALVNGHCLQNEMDKARRVLQLMIEKGCAPNIVTYSTMINRYCKGNLKEALKFFQTMQNGGLELDIVPYTILIDGLCKAGHIEVAKELFRQLSDSGLKPNVYKYGVMINGLCKEGLPDEQIGFLGAWEIMTVCLIVAIIM
ncbi:pentatricopeptide repeat-containing protein At1g62930, chloroplastic-like [Gossypium hirsutum]|uniref:Pentatricopeptide repeat-containing protein At1g62930, chloroplastic-like n=1 Tax=Gossypium hirsutum TaxID=3635 RepID=A0A1U8HTZ4_GOSHI|nr:pentatricopeptide repeat-containing protein At1g62930, chloroplastic-like [Gossypium hirsutum]